MSRRNLLALLGKLDWPSSARTIVKGDCFRDGRPIDDVVLVYASRREDDEHCARRAEPPGPMHPRTEACIERCDSRETR